MGLRSKRIKEKSLPVLKKKDLFLELEGLKCVSSLDLKIRYYYIKMYPASSNFTLKSCLEVNMNMKKYLKEDEIAVICSKRK